MPKPCPGAHFSPRETGREPSGKPGVMIVHMKCDDCGVTWDETEGE